MKLLSAEDLNFENDLAHFGVLGMKWGRRKAKSSSGGSKKQIAKKPISQEEQKKRLKTVAKVAGIVALAGVGVAAGYGLGSVSSKKEIKSLTDRRDYEKRSIESERAAFNSIKSVYDLKRQATMAYRKDTEPIDRKMYTYRPKNNAWE